jgi:DNA-binding NarL/FixJ family response regulator
MSNPTPPQRSTPSARLIIADDHEIPRKGLRTLLESERGLEVVGEATNGREALELCQHLHPDLALLDVRMPEMDGLEATRAIKQCCPATSVIIITVHENADYLMAAIRAGAAGYLLKDTGRRELLTAVRQVLRGEQFLNTELTRRLLQHLAGESAPATTETTPIEQLTAREMEVLSLLTRGKTNREIAYHLVISAGTVKVHVQHIIAKLHVSDRTQAAVRAIELGLLQR